LLWFQSTISQFWSFFEIKLRSRFQFQFFDEWGDAGEKEVVNGNTSDNEDLTYHLVTKAQEVLQL